SLKFVAGRLNVSDQTYDRTNKLSVLPKTERVTVRIDDIGQRLKLFPLRLVVRVFEFSRVGALAGRFQLNKSNKRVVNSDRIVGTSLQIANRRFSHRSYRTLGKLAKLGNLRQQVLERRTQLIFRLSFGARIAQFGFRLSSET
ncbi:hypothetical protein, partial [Candidatus Binatus sp.]|uniref:hypothetical protein n=1 Tax=Candidatus Binatus sp. TaxID=2811406 RepID=UPI003BAE8ACC